MTAEQLVMAVVAFVGTAVDDLVVLAALFLTRSVSGRPRAWAIVGGQYVGYAAILVLALAAASGLRIVPNRWIWLLGLVPIAFGIWSLWQLRGTAAIDRKPLACSMSGIATLAFANGADNIAIFTPLFRSLRISGSVLTAVLFLALIGLWCAIGAALGTNRAAAATAGRVAHWLVPLVFIGIGLLVVIDGGATLAARHSG
ncbi:cadmium resistance transporter [Nocardia sp. NEAU-G5]|uniref:Cadmium resistance transporter n=1 Tax=Nocardia albiluteola TaxID=2842303 RepID=A0ABS6BA33_9NOCA|nr:cadmium resistance transporter [Nocardia albiluteola]MBU3066058.1 cadmium resistance transporter [Nocardia albiluteola]